MPNRTAERSKRAVLETAVEVLDGYERRLLADLRNAGWRFQSIRAARQHLTTLRAVDRFNADQDAAALAAALNPKRRTG